MRYLNFSNVEELIFSNAETHRLLPSYFFGYFEQWKLSKRVPMLRSFGKTAVLDFLNQLDEHHIESLSEFFGERIVVEKLNYNIVSNLKIPLSQTEVCDQLCGVIGFSNYSMWRDDMHLYISFWR